MHDDGPRTYHELTVLAVAVGIGAFVLAKQVDPALLVLLGAVPVLLFLRIVLAKRSAREVGIALLRTSWGEPTKRPRDPAALRALFEACDGAAQSPAALDDATWNDLDLDRIFERLDRTLCAPGEYMLYEILRTPRLDTAVLEERERRIAALEADGRARDVLRVELLLLDRSPLGPLTDLLFGPPPEKHPNRIILTVRAALPIVGVAGALLGFGVPAVLVALAAVITNAISHFQLKNEIAAAADGIRYLADLVQGAHRLGAVGKDEGAGDVAPLLDEIAAAAKDASVIGKSGGRVGWTDRGGGADVLQAGYEYVAILFLNEVRHYYAVLEHLADHLAELRRLFRLVGELDALQSVASWRAGLPRSCRPTFIDARGEAMLRIDDAVHPLLDEPVPNSVALGRQSLVVTGSNMSGKSTFLRTVGLSVILAQTVHTVPAGAYEAVPLRVASSVTIRDDVMSGRSFYLAEAERLLRLVRFAEEPGPALVLVDEPLRGTNSTERVAAATEILLHLARVGALTIVATHEQLISEMITDREGGAARSGRSAPLAGGEMQGGATTATPRVAEEVQRRRSQSASGPARGGRRLSEVGPRGASAPTEPAQRTPHDALPHVRSGLPRYAPCHLGDEVGEDGLSFPHRVLPGIATTHNAIALLGRLGYPDDLVDGAERRAATIRDG